MDGGVGCSPVGLRAKREGSEKPPEVGSLLGYQTAGGMLRTERGLKGGGGDLQLGWWRGLSRNAVKGTHHGHPGSHDALDREPRGIGGSADIWEYPPGGSL